MSEENAIPRVRILLVEDDEDDFVLIDHFLGDLRWAEPNLEWIDNYDDGLQTILENRHDAYLLDYRLGAKTGLELLREVTERGCKGPLILLTGQGDWQIDLAAMESGAVDYLAKEYLNPEILERSIRYAIHRKRAERDLAEMQRRLSDSREQERLALARELHDGPLQELLGVRLHLGAIRHELPDRLLERLDMTLDNLQQVADFLRDLCGQLRPPALSPFGLDKAIRSALPQFRMHMPDVQIELDLDEDRTILDETTSLALYRIFQNALSNISKHAGASRVRVLLRLFPNEILLQVEDDGKGFVVPKNWMRLARQGHYGLLGAAERAESIGGRLLVRSRPGQGTALTVIVPRSSASLPTGGAGDAPSTDEMGKPYG